MLVADYIASLPEGLASYPDARCKMSVITTFIEGFDVDSLVSVLPPQAQELLRNPPPESVWVSEAIAQAIFLAVIETQMESDSAFLVYARERNRALISRPLYRAFYYFMSGQRAARVFNVAFGRFHQGIDSEVLAYTKTSISLRMVHPPHLFAPLIIRGTTTGIEEAIVLAGGNNVVVDLTFETESTVRTHVTWDE